MADDEDVRRRWARGYAWIVVTARPLVVVAWVAAAVCAVVFLPGLGSSSTAPIGDIVPTNAKALVAEQDAVRLFGAPVATDTVVVERRAGGLPRRQAQAHLDLAAAVDRRVPGAGVQGVKLAVPLLNVTTPGVRWRERDTTALTYLFLAPDLNLLERRDAARSYERRLPPPAAGTQRGVTGAGPARLAQFDAIDTVLPWITLATVLVIVIVVALAFRSFLAPLVTLATAGIAYLIAVRVLGWAGERVGERAPSEIEPVLVVLLLGLVTDYTVFFMAEARRRLVRGDSRVVAARHATARIMPIVVVAGVLVTAGAASLLAGRMAFFQVFGPGLALCAVVVTLISITLVPAVIGLLGARLFGGEARAAAEAEAAGDDDAPPAPSRFRQGLWRVLTARPVAFVVMIGAIAALGVAAAGARQADLGVSFIPSLESHTEVRSVADAAGRGFVPGVLAPTDVIVQQPGIGARGPALTRLQRLIAREPGVTAALGAGRGLPAPLSRYVLARDGGAARFVVLLDDEPTGAAAIRTLRGLQRDMPGLLRAAGLPAGAQVSYGGDTALSAETVDLLIGDLWRVGIVTFLVMYVLLALFLRAVLAPLMLLLGSALAFAGSFGLTSLLLPHTVGGTEFVYYVPLVAAVLLAGLGSDYNVMIVGRIREEARRRPLREAIGAAVPAASRAITIAGLTLATTFALLAIVPLRPFRELAMLMTIGVLLDALFVRPVLVPAMIAAGGRLTWWPSRVASRSVGEAVPEGAGGADVDRERGPEPEPVPATVPGGARERRGPAGGSEPDRERAGEPELLPDVEDEPARFHRGAGATGARRSGDPDRADDRR
jgi:putative drug exporter of the RND superfamily